MSDYQEASDPATCGTTVPSFAFRAKQAPEEGGGWKTVGFAWPQRFGQEGFVIELDFKACTCLELVLVPVSKESFAAYRRT